jgi:hypothetical protein
MPVTGISAARDISPPRYASRPRYARDGHTKSPLWIPGDRRLRTKELNVGGLTVYAVEQRYMAGTSNPMSLNERPTWDDAEEAIAQATDALSHVAADLASAGWVASE